MGKAVSTCSDLKSS